MDSRNMMDGVDSGVNRQRDAGVQGSGRGGGVIEEETPPSRR
jgi:hypothetical protein